MSDAREVFSRIYDTDHWRGGSGEGSTAVASAPYREVVRHLVNARDVRSVVDIGCGDWQVGALVDWSPVSYVGLDVVPSVVRHHQDVHAGPGIRFAVADARSADLPRADLLLVKDVLQHWPTADVVRFLHTQLRRYRYVLATNDVASVHWAGPVNTDVELGAWRPLDLQREPFGVSPRWVRDYPVDGGTWTKRMTLCTSGLAARLPGSALRRVRAAR